jgi:hypothetical protein
LVWVFFGEAVVGGGSDLNLSFLRSYRRSFDLRNPLNDGNYANSEWIEANKEDNYEN